MVIRMAEYDRVNDANREQAIKQLLDSFSASRSNRTIICHALGINPDQYEVVLRRMDNQQLNDHYYDVEDNDFLVGPPIGTVVN